MAAPLLPTTVPATSRRSTSPPAAACGKLTASRTSGAGLPLLLPLPLPLLPLPLLPLPLP